MNILDQIFEYKQKEVLSKSKGIPVEVLKGSYYFNHTCVPFAQSIKKGHGIIAEHKRKSPSKKIINDQVSLPDVIQGYEKGGASALSVLTDTFYFGGSLDDLQLARQISSLPMLRKDFIVDPYQVYETKAFGADALLLIAAYLSPKALKELSSLAKDIGLDVLVEIHQEDELEKCILDTVDLIGVNNRNLKTFEVSIETSKQLSGIIPSNYVKISESGIQSPETVKILSEYGFEGFLMGEYFMKHLQPGKTLYNFLQEL